MPIAAPVCVSRSDGVAVVMAEARGSSRHQLRQTEVQNFDVAALGHKDVRRLDIAVNDSLAVGSAERVCNLDPPFKDFLESAAACRQCDASAWRLP